METSSTNNSLLKYEDVLLVSRVETIKKQIEGLDIETLLDTDPTLSLTPFTEDMFIFINTEEELKKLTTNILENEKVFGVDIEQTYLDSYQGFNCLIQISTAHINYIIDAIVLKATLAPYLKLIFENKKIVKVFYASTSDLQWLNRDYGIFVVNIFDVYHASYFLDKHKDRSLVGLLNQYCSYKMDKQKKKDFQVSDWRKRPLTREQMNYAALDAHYLTFLRNVILEEIKKVKQKEETMAFLKQKQAACLKEYEEKSFNVESTLEQFGKIFASLKEQEEKIKHKTEVLVKEKKIFLTLCKLRDDIARKIDTNPDKVCSSALLLRLSIEEFDASNQDLISQKLKEFSNETDKITLILEDHERLKRILKAEEVFGCDERLLGKKVSKNKEEGKALRREKHEQKFTLKKKLYENCQVLAPDGELLAHTKRKRLNWYLSKGLAVLVTENPPTIKLNFEPSGRDGPNIMEFSIDKELYLKHHRQNRCVVCGQPERLSRYHIVPALYRPYLPEELKNHNAHDILLTCFRCQEKAHSEADKFKVEIGKNFDIPLVQFEKAHEIKISFGTIQRVLSAYMKHKDIMQKDKRKKMKSEIRGIFFTLASYPHLLPEVVEKLKTFTYKEDGQVKITQEFSDYFTQMPSFKTLVYKNSSKEFKNIHGKLIMEKFKTLEEIRKFIDDWRMFFIKTMDPQFLPHDWHVMLDSRAKIKKQ